MNRGYDGNDIFVGNQNKKTRASNQMKIRLFAYCLMDNHYNLSPITYHLVLRQRATDQSSGVQRKDDRYFEPINR